MSRSRPAVFILDDDDSVRRALLRLLRAAGLVAEAFATAEEFLQAGGRPEPGCLVLDQHLPGLSGLELYERLRAEGRAVPVVFITAFEDERVREQALQAGAVAFLRKPFEERELLDAVARALHEPPARTPDNEV
jgi:FixJ family two-component response regulator